MQPTEKRCRTAATIATELRVPLYRVSYVLKTRQHIKPLGRAGNVRVYSEEATAQVRHEINAMDAARSSRG